MSNDYPISGLINPQDKKDLEKLIADLNEASKVAKTVVLGGGDAKNLKQVADAQDKINKAQREAETHAKKIEALNQKMAVTAQKEADRIEATRKKNADAELKRLEKEAQAQRKVTEQVEKKAQAQNKNVLNFKNASPGSINQLSSANAILNKRLLDVNQTTEEGARKANNLRSAIDKNHKKIAEMSPEWKKQQMNIGNYGNAFNFVADKAKSFGDTLKGLALGGIATLGIATSLGGIVSMFKKGVGSAIEMEEKTEKLNFALNQNKPATDRMLSFASKMSANSLFGKGAIMEAETFALSLGRSEEQTKKMVTAAMGLSRVTGVDLQTAMTQLNMTYSGGVGRLAKYAPELKNLTAEQLKAGVGVEMLAEKLGKFGTSGLDTTSGKITLFKKAWGGLTRAMGEGSTGVIGVLVDRFTSMTKAVTKFVSVPVSEKMQEEKTQVELLTKTLINQHAPLAVRNNAYDTLAKIAPAVVEGIDKENVNVQKLNQNLADYNRLQIKAIALKVKQEEMTAAGEAEGIALRNAIKAENDFQKTISRFETTIGKLTNNNRNFIGELVNYRNEFNKGIITAAEYAMKIEKLGVLAGGQKAQFQAGLALTNVIVTEQRLKKAQDESIRISQEVADFEARLKADASYVPPPTTTTTPSGGSGGATKTQKEIDEEKLKSILELMKTQQDAFEMIANDESKSLMERSVAYDNFTASRIKSLQLQNTFDNKYNGSEKVKNDLILQNESNKIKIDADKWYQEESKKQNEKAQAEKEAREKEYRDNMFNDAQRDNERMIKENEILTDKLLEENANRYIKGEQSYEEYEKNKQKIAESSAKELIRIQIQTAQNELNILENMETWDKETTDKIFSYQEKIAHLEKQLNKDVADEHKKLDDERQKRLEDYADAVKSVMGAIGDIYSAYSDRRLAEIASLQENNNTAQQAELDAVDRKYNTETRAKTRAEIEKDKINTKYAEKQKKLEYEKAKIDRNLAIWKKAQALSEVAIETALGVIAAKGNVAKIALVVALGVSQGLAISMQKIPELPKYRTGTNFHPGGVATVGDGSRELLEMPDGSKYLASKEITANFPRGMKVLKNSDTENVLKSGVTIEQNAIDISSLDAKIDKSNKFLKQIAEKQQINRIFVEDKSQYNRAKWQ